MFSFRGVGCIVRSVHIIDVVLFTWCGKVLLKAVHRPNFNAAGSLWNYWVTSWTKFFKKWAINHAKPWLRDKQIWGGGKKDFGGGSPRRDAKSVAQLVTGLNDIIEKQGTRLDETSTSLTLESTPQMIKSREFLFCQELQDDVMTGWQETDLIQQFGEV